MGALFGVMSRMNKQLDDGPRRLIMQSIQIVNGPIIQPGESLSSRLIVLQGG